MMVKKKVKQAIESKMNELKMNLENNYKDLARSALKEVQELLEAYRESGELKEKDYKKYKQIADTYALGMVNYHH